ncbi:hypothetical protein [Muribaculum intestinale]|nr:hypothetical protein [Muribaculum intestinale]QQR08491.1 hypothetical protein I5Q90_10780 [Muribaculum intestinale]
MTLKLSLFGTQCNDNRVLLSCSGSIQDNMTIEDGVEIIICNNAIIECRNLTLGRNSLLRIESGSLIVASGCVLTLGENSRLDARGGTLNLTGARCNLKSGGTLLLSDFPVKGGILAGGWAAENDSLINSEDYHAFQHMRSYLDAPICKAFDGTEFKGRWDMDRAYPQWFADAGCDDWSVPINKAIALKTTGDVFLPAGLYYVKHTILVTMGIRLIGENGTQEVKPGLNPVCSTVLEPRPTVVKLMPPIPSNVARPSISTGFSHGVVVAVNVVDSFVQTDDISLDKKPAIGNTKYYWKRAYPCPGTAIENIMILNKWNYSAEAKAPAAIKEYCIGMPFLRGIFVAGGARIESVLFDGLWQSILWQSNYCDCKTLARCTLHRPGCNNFEINANCLPVELNNDGSPKIESEYAIDMGTLGDALVFHGNALHDPEFTKGVCLRQCHGGVVDANIINCSLEIFDSNGLSVTGNHFEGISPRIYINNSVVNIDSNYFERCENASIYISRVFPNVPMIRLSNNIFQWQARYQDARTSQEYADFVEAMSHKFGYDVVMPADINVEISNCYRTYNNSKVTPTGVPYGILTATETPVGDNYKVEENTKFNSVSFLASCQSRVMPVNKVLIPNSSAHNINSIGLYPFLLNMSHGNWVGKSGIYRYKYLIIWSDERRIYTCGTGNVSLRDFMFDGGNTVVRRSFKDTDTTGTILINVSGYDEMTGLNFLVHLYRGYQSQNGGAIEWEESIVPVAGSRVIYDNGMCASGFAWKKIGAQPAEIPFNDGVTGIDYHGQNVDVYSTKSIDFTIGEWRVGDRVYNVGTDDSWTMKVKK